jgi:pSer/pThr/pTyr-binding forkhead associated (FHA) protein
MQLSIKVRYGRGSERKLVLGPGDCERIGRAKEFDRFAIGDPFMSRAHFEVRCEGAGKCLIRDLESANGTYVNGEKVSAEVELSDGDRVFAGHTPFVIDLNH